MFFYRMILLMVMGQLWTMPLPYESYLESWDTNWEEVLTQMPAVPDTSALRYEGVCLHIAFVSYMLPGLNGLQFADPYSDACAVLRFVRDQGGTAKLSYGGANYYMSQTQGWPENIPELALEVAEIVDCLGFLGVDFTIEDPLPEGKTALQFAQELHTFLQQVRVALPSEEISITIPGQGWDTYWQYLAQMVAEDHTVDYIRMMEYDLWIGASSYPAQIVGDLLTYTSSPLACVAPNYAPGWGIPSSMIQLGLMPGVDDIGNVLSLEQAKALTQAVISMGIYGVMTWDLDRDAGFDPPYSYSQEIRNTLYRSEGLPMEGTVLRGKEYRMRSVESRFERQEPPPHGAPSQ